MKWKFRNTNLARVQKKSFPGHVWAILIFPGAGEPARRKSLRASLRAAYALPCATFRSPQNTICAPLALQPSRTPRTPPLANSGLIPSSQSCTKLFDGITTFIKPLHPQRTPVQDLPNGQGEDQCVFQHTGSRPEPEPRADPSSP